MIRINAMFSLAVTKIGIKLFERPKLVQGICPNVKHVAKKIGKGIEAVNQKRQKNQAVLTYMLNIDHAMPEETIKRALNHLKSSNEDAANQAQKIYEFRDNNKK